MDATLPLRGIHSIVPLLHEGPNHDLGPLLHTGRSGERRTIHQDVRPLHDTQGVTPPTQTVAKAVDWTPEEDYDLLKLRRRRKPWKEIKTVLKGRSTYSCQQRYHDLKEKQGLMYVHDPLFNQPPQYICSHC